MSQQINLYNPAFIPPKELLTGTSLVAATALVIAALITATIWARHMADGLEGQLSGLQSQLKTAQAAVEAIRQAAAARTANPELVRSVAVAKADIDLRERILNLSASVLGQPGQGYTEYLRGLARQVSPGVWVTGFRVAGANGALSLSGRTVDKSLLPDYVVRLNRESAFRGKSFGGIQIDAVALDAPVSFVDSTGAVPPAPTSPAVGAGKPEVSSPRKLLSFHLLATKTEPAARQKGGQP